MLQTPGNATAGDSTANTHMYSNTDTFVLGYNSILTSHNNTVTILNDNTINGNVTGGYVSLHIETGNAESGNASNALDNYAKTYAYVNNSELSATNNTVKIYQESKVNGRITGGQVNLNIITGNAKSGKLTKKGVVSYTDSISSIDISNTILQANENKVTFGSILTNGDDIIGGAINIELKTGSATYYDDSTGEKTNNDITTTGVIIEAIGNTITLDEYAKINNFETSLYGGKMTGNYKDNEQYSLPKFDIFTDNTLNMKARDIKVNNVANFKNYEFTIFPNLAKTGIAQLTAANIIFGTNEDNFKNKDIKSKNSTVEVKGIHEGKLLRAGDTFILMQATDSMSGDASGTTNTILVQQDISFIYNIKTEVKIAEKKVTATVLGCKDDSSEDCVIPPDENETDGKGEDSGENNAAMLNPQLKALSESRLSALTQITRGTDAFAYDVFDVMRAQADIETVNGGFYPFVMINGSQTRYHSGSHIDSNDFLLTSGLSYQNDYLQAAVFVEGGWSSYDTYNSFLNANNVHGNGHNHYVGAGILGKYEFSNNFYADGSLRFGRSNNEFDTKDIQNSSNGQYAQYSIKTPYISAHIGFGYVFDLNQKNTFDISVKYLWAHLGGKNLEVTNIPIQFQSIDSKRLRLQNKLTHQYNKNLSVSAGLSYEYEFDGEAKATIKQYYNFDFASVRGSTGIASLGLYAQPSEQSPLKIDFSAQGYTGKREGIAANLRFDYAF